MAGATETHLWMHSIGVELDAGDAEGYRQKLVAALDAMGERAEVLAGEIALDLPEFTAHDKSHSDAIWVLADLISGADLTLTPSEAFVFGAAVLLHDLGMASAAYVEGPGAIKEEPRWSDAIASVLRQTTGEIPSREAIANPDPEVAEAATRQVLRELHAEHAERLATARWEDKNGNEYALLESPELRESLGPVIGRIAHSHWWSVSELGERLGTELGASPGAPASWTIRPLLIACLLRLADASHLDGSRAPRFLRLLRDPAGEAGRHWDFQERLAQPYRRDDRIVFTGTAFSADDAEAWWLCADTLAMVDREFRSVDSLLADCGQPRLAIRGVAGAENLEALASLIPTDDWMPVDARVQVSDVVHLVEQLGGRELYGSKPEVPLRELVQNASDSVRARRVVDDCSDDWGSVTVAVGEADADGRRWLEVLDTGVGMSREVLASHLLDFGRSFWDSRQVVEEFPGLLASGFQPTGRFGIGFFSVFMWSDDVDVVSRRYEAAKSDTNVLEFRGGVAKRPLLRPAQPAEQLREPGTRVRIMLDAESVWRLGLDPDEPTTILRDLCAWLAPALDVDLYVQASKDRLLAVGADDWKEMPMEQLAARIALRPVRRSGAFPPEDEEGESVDGVEDGPDGEAEEVDDEAGFNALGRLARPLKDENGKTVGRLAMLAPEFESAVTVVGGLRATALTSLSGVLLARATTASRNSGVPLVSLDGLAAWASEQARTVAEMDGVDYLEVARLVWVCDGELGELPIARTDDGLLSRDEARRWAETREKITVASALELRNLENVGPVELSDGVVAVDTIQPYMALSGMLEESRDRTVEDWPVSLRGDPLELMHDAALVSAFADAVGQAWGVERQALLAQIPAEPVSSRTIGRRNGNAVAADAWVWERPASPSD